MNQFRDQKDMKMAMSGRMGLLAGGAILLFTAVTSTLTYGINMFMIALEASKGNAEYTEMLETSDLSITFLRVLAVCFLLLAIVEIVSSVFSLKFSNRLDKCFLMRKIVIVLLVTELLMQLLLLITRMLNPGMLLTAVFIPLYMLWSVTRLCKLSREYPDKVYAINKEKRAPAAPPKPKKSLHERAMMPTSLSEETEKDN